MSVFRTGIYYQEKNYILYSDSLFQIVPKDVLAPRQKRKFETAYIGSQNERQKETRQPLSFQLGNTHAFLPEVCL